MFPQAYVSHSVRRESTFTQWHGADRPPPQKADPPPLHDTSYLLPVTAVIHHTRSYVELKKI